MKIIETKEDVELYDIYSNKHLKHRRLIMIDDLFIEYTPSKHTHNKGILYNINDYINNLKGNKTNYSIAKVCNPYIDNKGILRGTVELYENEYIKSISELGICDVVYIPRLPMVDTTPYMITKLIIK